MAAITIAATSYPFNTKTTLSATPNTMQEYVIPSNAKSVEIQSESHPCVVVFSGGTDNTVITSEIGYPVAKDTSFFWNLQNSRQSHSVWLASRNGSKDAYLVVDEA